mgnify:CR=1 FL=1
MVYAITMFTVTAGVLVDGDDGFFAGHVVATTCWVALGAAALAYARRRSGSERTAVITGGLILIGAAMAKLFLFDLATLDVHRADRRLHLFPASRKLLQVMMQASPAPTSVTPVFVANRRCRP